MKQVDRYFEKTTFAFTVSQYSESNFVIPSAPSPLFSMSLITHWSPSAAIGQSEQLTVGCWATGQVQPYTNVPLLPILDLRISNTPPSMMERMILSHGWAME